MPDEFSAPYGKIIIDKDQCNDLEWWSSVTYWI